MRNLVRTSFCLAALLCPTLNTAAQPITGTTASTAPATPPVGDQRTLLAPEDSYGATYGTSNLGRQPSAVVPPHTPSAQRTLQLRPNDLLSIQNARRQPPATLNAFDAYLRSNALLTQMAAVPTGGDTTLSIIMGWNLFALDMTSIDHTTAGVGNIFEPTYAEQFGPPRAARAMAMVHLAMFEAANLLDPQFQSYHEPGSTDDVKSMVLAHLPAGRPAPTGEKASIAAAISRAAFDTLVALYPKKQALLEAANLRIGIIVSSKETATAGDAVSRLAFGTEIGAAAAQAVLALREHDGSDYNAHDVPCAPAGKLPAPLCWEAYFPTQIPGVPPQQWTADDINANPLQLGANWYKVKPFVLSDHEFVTDAGIVLPNGPRPLPTASDMQNNLAELAYGDMMPDPHGGPGKVSSKYGVHEYGGFGAPAGFPISFPPNQGKRALTTTKRDDAQTKWGQFWGYDATALLCAPPRLYNMVATSYLLQNMSSATAPHRPVEVARYLALVNIGLADAGVAAWEAKFKYNLARPITFIRHSPGSLVDDVLWTPLGQVSSNGAVTNVTPPFPSYPSGHAVFGGALFTSVARLMSVNKNDSPFDFVSDEYNGQTIGGDGRPRDAITAHYVSLAAAEWENAESRIWLGIHWQWDADDGSALGDAIGDAVTTRILQKLP